MDTTLDIPEYFISFLGKEDAGKRTLCRALINFLIQKNFNGLDLNFFPRLEAILPNIPTEYDRDFSKIKEKAECLQFNDVMEFYLYGIEDNYIDPVCKIKLCCISEEIYNMDFENNLTNSDDPIYENLRSTDFCIYCFDAGFDWGISPISYYEVSPALKALNIPFLYVLTKSDEIININHDWMELLKNPKTIYEYLDGMKLLHLFYWNIQASFKNSIVNFPYHYQNYNNPFDRDRLFHLREKIMPKECGNVYPYIYQCVHNNNYVIPSKDNDNNLDLQHFYVLGNLHQNNLQNIGLLEIFMGIMKQANLNLMINFD